MTSESSFYFLSSFTKSSAGLSESAGRNEEGTRHRL